MSDPTRQTIIDWYESVKGTYSGRTACLAELMNPWRQVLYEHDPSIRERCEAYRRQYGLPED